MTIRKTLLIVPILGVAFAFYLLNKASQPPLEANLIKNFSAGQSCLRTSSGNASFGDKLVRVADWGVETTDSPLPEVPPKGSFPVSRYREYVSLLNAINARVADRTEGPEPEIRIAVWGSGFAGDTRHIAICWVEKAPPNQTDSLDTFYKSPKPRSPGVPASGWQLVSLG